jgi:hypothetical protein
MTMGDELLHTAIQRKEPQVDEKLYLELYGRRPTKASRPKALVVALALSGSLH